MKTVKAINTGGDEVRNMDGSNRGEMGDHRANPPPEETICSLPLRDVK